MLEKLLYLNKGELRRLIPFFCLFLLLYLMLSLGEGLSLSLFINRVGAHKLPQFYGYTAIVIFTIIFIYIYFLDKLNNKKMFYIIICVGILTYLAAFLLFKYFNLNDWCFGIFLINREASFTIILIHFGNYLLDFFSRKELERVLPVVYSAGRLGGIIGGGILGILSPILGVLNLIFVYFLFAIASIILIYFINKIDFKDTEEVNETPIRFKDFFKYLATSVFLILLSLNTFFFIMSRTFLNFEYNTFFDAHFSNEVKMAEFLGYYTSISLIISLIIQMLFVNRIVSFIGLKSGHLLYNLFLFIAVIMNFFPLNIFNAVFCRFVENELRLGYRTSIINLIANIFPKNVRAKARAFSLGIVIPAATLCTSFILIFLNTPQFLILIPVVGFIIFLIYFAQSFLLYNSFDESNSIKKVNINK